VGRGCARLNPESCFLDLVQTVPGEYFAIYRIRDAEVWGVEYCVRDGSTGSVEKQFDFCRAMTALCEDISRRHPEFRHIRMPEVGVSFAQTRSPVEWGMQARLTPLRFEGGARTEIRKGREWAVQRVYHRGQEALYLLTFFLPRFLNLSYREKLITVFHELFHISPEFNGDIRRFSGACFIHTGSQKRYDQQMAVFAEQYLQLNAPEELLRFLQVSFRELQAQCGSVVGVRIAIPRLIPVGKVA
jgi:predicted metallopeptidase